jgi:hypothetical protein
MWKKISFAAVLGLSLCPTATMAATLNPFDGIVDGIAQQLASGGDLTMTSTNDKGVTLGGNVVIGDNKPKQLAEIDGDAKLEMADGNDISQAVNSARSEFPVMAMQETAIGGNTNLTSSNNVEGAVQAINLVTVSSSQP